MRACVGLAVDCATPLHVFWLEKPALRVWAHTHWANSPTHWPLLPLFCSKSGALETAMSALGALRNENKELKESLLKVCVCVCVCCLASLFVAKSERSVWTP